MAASETMAADVPGRGVDAKPEQRPGVPMERSPSPLEGAHWAQPGQQVATVRITRRMELATLTPVFGTAQPPRGVSGLIRQLAYRIPEHHAKHWMLLLAADRVDVVGHRLLGAAKWLPLAIPIVAALGFAAARQRRRNRWARAARLLYRRAA